MTTDGLGDVVDTEGRLALLRGAAVLIGTLGEGVSDTDLARKIRDNERLLRELVAFVLIHIAEMEIAAEARLGE